MQEEPPPRRAPPDHPSQCALPRQRMLPQPPENRAKGNRALPAAPTRALPVAPTRAQTPLRRALPRLPGFATSNTSKIGQP
jgi:hypothetical protein